MVSCCGLPDRPNVANTFAEMIEALRDAPKELLADLHVKLDSVVEDFLSEFTMALPDPVLVDARRTYVARIFAEAVAFVLVHDSRAVFVWLTLDSEPEPLALDLAPVPQDLRVTRITWAEPASTTITMLRRTPLAWRQAGRSRSWLSVLLPVASWRLYPQVCRLFKQRR
jgi:hypothetical protein